jgi:hypothetical protein
MSLFDDLKNKFSQTNSEHIGQAVEEMVNTAIRMRKVHERRWFDNNFFDDGYHFRVVSKRTGRVIDHVNYTNGYIERAIPRASRQIRGVTNLLFAAEPYPVIYPERITIEQFRDQTGQINQQAYQTVADAAKKTAQLRGNWVTNEWLEQELALKLIDMILMAAKNSVSYLQVFSDTDKEKICTGVYDAFDIVTYGDRRELKEEPFIAKVAPMDLIDVFKNPLFDKDKVQKLSPDNKYATSEIKDAYMRVKFGSKVPSDEKQGSILIKEAFIKELLSDENWKQAIKGDTGGAMEGKSHGDGVMRHVFSAGGVTLRDEYIDYDDYPFADFRFEPGMLYQTPFIERFIPQNKSIDVIITRLEKWVNAMVVGVYQQRKGENMELSNFPGGQIIKYETTPLTQMATGSVGATPFNVIEMLDKYIDEQGATTAGGMNVPAGVKSGVAIESVKATEYANLKISTMMLKKTMKRITELMLERASKDYMTPHEATFQEDGEPKYFDVIGEKGMQMSQQVNKQLPQAIISIKKDLKVRIEIEPGLGLTMDGKKEAMQQIINFMIQMASPPVSAIPISSLQQIIKKFLESFGYGDTQEFMESVNNPEVMNQMSDADITKMKVAILETLKDAGAVGPEHDKTLVDSTKVGVLESLKESGMIDKVNKAAEPVSPVADNPEIDAIPYKDAPEDIKRQMEKNAGLIPSTGVSPAGTDQVVKHVQAIKSAETPIVDINSQKQAELALKEKQMSSYPISKFRKAGQNGNL